MTDDRRERQAAFQDSVWFSVMEALYRHIGFMLIPMPLQGPAEAPPVPAGGWSPMGVQMPVSRGAVRIVYPPPQGPSNGPPVSPGSQAPSWYGPTNGPVSVFDAATRAINAAVANVPSAVTSGFIVRGPSPFGCGDPACSNCASAGEPIVSTFQGEPVVNLPVAARDREEATESHAEREVRRFHAPGVLASGIVRVEQWDNPQTPHMAWLSVLARVENRVGALLSGIVVGEGGAHAEPQHALVRAMTLAPRDLSRVHVSVDERASMIDIAIDAAVDVTGEVFPQAKPLS